MSKKVIIAFLLMVISIIGLTGCNPVDPPCDPGSLLAPDLVSPDSWEVMDGSAAILEWSYPDTCEPDEFEIILSQERDYSVIEHTQLVPGDATTWTPPTLDIAEEYFWRVRAKVGSTFGAYSFQMRSFFTLPYCTASDLFYGPSLLLPVSGGVFERGSDSLEWEWQISSCIPESYRVELSTEREFIDTSLNGATGNPSTRWGPGSPLAAATQYYWRITAFADGTWGTPSIGFTFITDPVCTAASLVTPVAETPTNNSTVTTLTPEFTWSYPDPSCLPEGFHLKTSETPDMSVLFLYADNPNIATRSFQAGYPFNDCQEYYYSVAVISEGVESDFTVPKRFIIDTAGACECDPANLPVPDLIWPEPVWTGNYDIVPLNPTLEWSNPGPCTPDGYQVKLSDLPDNVDPSLNGDVTDGLITNYTPSALLQPARQYWWHVFSTFEGALSGHSNYGAFFTEPECGSAADLVPPDLILPADGASIDTLHPMLHYEQPLTGCIPDSYLINLQTDENFGGTNLVGQIAFPSTAAGPGQDLANCTMYYWKVAGVQDVTPGPDSEVFSFYTNEGGTCAPPIMPPTPPGIPATAKINNFCREGTFPEHHKAIWTYETGDHTLAIARNPFTTYLKLLVIDEETKQPLEQHITCWSVLTSFEEGWRPPDPLEGQYQFEDLPIEEPPPTPTPLPLVCNRDLEEKDCKAAGGTPVDEKRPCDCD